MKSTVLVIGYVFPEPNSTAAGSRMLQLINFFMDQNYKVVFATSSKATERAFNLESINIEVVEILLNDASFDVFVKELNPNIVLFDRFMTEEQFGWRVADCCPAALRILDTEDLHFLRTTRQKALNSNTIGANDYASNSIVKREIASIYRSDLSLIISERELSILMDDFKIDSSLLMYLPFMLDINNLLDKQSFKPYSEKKDFVSIGNFLHPPNLDAVHYMKTSIWPLIKSSLTETKLHIYGAYASSAVRAMHNAKEGFLVHGYVADAFEAIAAAKVMLAPLRFGAGLKGKLIQAMQCGTPCAMSTIASEGLFAALEPNGVIENEISRFVAKSIELYTQEPLWNTSRANGSLVLKKRFNKEEHYSKFTEKLLLLQSQIKLHRSTNFIGQMLAHHQFQSTKYMSRWIEAKNANN